MDTPILDDSPVARGTRLRKVRRMAGLSTEQLATSIGCSRQTISYWENATYSGLSHKGAVKVIAAIKEFNVSCDISWLLYGIGQIAHWEQPTDSASKRWQVTETNKPQSATISPSLQQEIALFEQSHPDSIVTQITHDAMQPIYEPGDWLGGCFEPVHAGLFNKPCIINLAGSIEVGILTPSNSLGLFNLRGMRDLTQTEYPPVIENVALQKAAKIVRVWRKG